ncbi:MAG: signal peptidase I [Oscillospiraceae bacterium]|nr:signal peptidase I [Oscillospiraceae bacterium]
MRVEFYEVNFKKPTTRFKLFCADVYDFVSTFMLAIIFVMITLVFLFRLATVEGTSMNPTLEDQDRLMVSHLTENYERGDIVVVSRVNDVSIVKRVIAVAGDTIDINFAEGKVYLNNELLNEDYILEPTYRYFSDGPEFPLTVPVGYVFVMGDNRNNSLDSRSGEIGLVNVQSILGKMIVDFNKTEAPIWKTIMQ